ncbi:MAG TPA: Crp/Fnr family transcriptional regulator [Thiotrichales bacterium]|nr:Crp/Fnr family transcriptional regulator [Thiotrichales bacterium]
MKENKQDIIKQSLKQHHLFSKLTDLQLDRVYRHCQYHALDDGQILFNQGEGVTAFYMVLNGKMKLFRTSPDGQEKIIELVNTGDVFAEALMFIDQTSYPVSSAALTATEVVGIDAKQFKNMLWDSPETCFLLLGDMSFRLRKLVNEIDELTLYSGTCRVASYLIHELGDNEKGFELDTAKNVIAARLSIKPETFSRIVKNLNTQGILSINGNSVTVHDIDALKQQSIQNY